MDFFENNNPNNAFPPSWWGGFPNPQNPPNNGFPPPSNPFWPPPANPMGGFPNPNMPPAPNPNINNIGNIPWMPNQPQEDINNIDIKSLNYLEILMSYLKEDKKHLMVIAFLFFIWFITIIYWAYSIYFIFWEFESWLHFFNEVTYIKALLIGFFNLLLTIWLMKIWWVLKYKRTPEILFIFYSIVFGGAFITLLIMGKISIYLFFIDFTIVLIWIFFFNYVASYKINAWNTDDLLKQVWTWPNWAENIIQGAAKNVVPTDLDVSLPSMDINIWPWDNFQGQPQQEVSQEENKRATILAKVKESLQEFIEENSINHILINEHKKKIYWITIQEEPSTQLWDYNDVILPTQEEIINKSLENKGLYINNEEEDEEEEVIKAPINNIGNEEEDFLNDIIEEPETNSEVQKEEKEEIIEVEWNIEAEGDNFGGFNSNSEDIEIEEEIEEAPKLDNFIESEEDEEEIVEEEKKEEVDIANIQENNLLDEIWDIFPEEVKEEKSIKEEKKEEPKIEDIDIGDFIDEEEKEDLLDNIIWEKKEEKKEPPRIKKKEKKSLNDDDIPDISKIDISDLDF